MRLDTSQQMRTEMRLRMAPRMIQSMEILQLPVMALQETDRAGAGREPDPRRPARIALTRSRRRRLAGAGTPKSRLSDAEPDEFDSLMSLDENWSEIYDEGPRRSRASLSEQSDRKQEAMQNMASRPRSFHDDLTDQLGFFDCEPIIREIAEYIIYNLDETRSLSSTTCTRRARLQRPGHARTGRGGAETRSAPGPRRSRRTRPA